MNRTLTLADAVELAARIHRDQRDKAGQPYILHPLRVMLRQADETSQIVAVLHDVLEDGSEITAETLREVGYSEKIIAALETLTKREEETYEEFIKRVEPHPLPRRVKLADLEDNMNLQRLERMGADDLRRIQKYHRAWKRLARTERAASIKQALLFGEVTNIERLKP